MKTKTRRLAAFAARADADQLACLLVEQVAWPQRYASKRNRRYSMQNTFWLFLGQVLATGASCQEVVARFLGRLAIAGLRASTNTAAYCKARMR